MVQYNCHLVKSFSSHILKTEFMFLKIPRNEVNIGELDLIWDIGLEKIALLISLSPRNCRTFTLSWSQSQPNSPESKQSTTEHENKCLLLHASEFCIIIVAITSWDNSLWLFRISESSQGLWAEGGKKSQEFHSPLKHLLLFQATIFFK